MKIRLAKVEDTKKILDIYTPYVLHSSATFEYDVPSLAEFQKRIEDTLEFFPYLVATSEDEIIGYAYASFFNVRKAYQYSCTLSVYVKENQRGNKIGSRLYDVMEEMLKRQNFQNLNACITFPNDESVRFHQKRGFVEVAHFHECGYKFDRWYDMIWMEKMIGEHTVKPASLKSIKEIEIGDIICEF